VLLFPPRPRPDEALVAPDAVVALEAEQKLLAAASREGPQTRLRASLTPSGTLISNENADRRSLAIAMTVALHRLQPRGFRRGRQSPVLSGSLSEEFPLCTDRMRA
jgi:hypothetical protein